MSAGIRAGSSNDGYVQVNGNDIITALSGGNVGIGVSSPSTKLHVNGTITATNFAGSGGITTDDWIVHAGDTDTKLGFSGADTISFHTAGAEVLKIGSTGNLELPRDNDYIKIGSGGPLNFVHTGSAAFISNSSGFLTHQCDTHQWKKGDGSAEYFRSNATGFAIGHVAPVRKFSVKSSGENAVSISLLDNNSTNEIWRVGQAADGDGYVEVLEDGGTVGCKLDASGNSFTMGNFGIGDASPSQLLTISHAANTTNGILIKNTNNSQASAIAQLELSGGDNSHGRVQFECNGKYATIRHDGNGHLDFYTNGSNQRLRIKDTGEVLIGGYTTFSSYTKLQVRGATSTISDGGQIFDVASTATATGGTRLAFGVNEDNYTWIRSYESSVGARDMVLATNNEKLRIASSGRIDILGDGGNAGFTLSNAYGQAGIFGGMYYEGSAWVRNAIGTRKGAGMYVNTGGHIAFLTSSQNSGTSATTNERLRICNDGRVGIKFTGNYTMNPNSTDLVIGDGGSGRGLTIWTAAGADNQTVSFQTNETLSRAEGEISYGPTNTSVTNNRNAMMFRVNSNERLRISSSGKVGIQVTDPKSLLHVYGPGDIRMGSGDTGVANIALQVEHADNYTGTHFMFEITDSAAWSFSGTHIAHGGGGSSYGLNITYIRAIAGREAGANNSGDTWRNGTHQYNSEVMTTGQIGLNPGAGSVSFVADDTPDGAGSTRSLYKISFSAAGQGTVTTWGKLQGVLTWASTSSNGIVKIKDKDGNVLWNSRP